MAAELKQVKGRLVSQEQLFVNESVSRKETETKAKNMEREICKLQKTLEDRSCQLEASSSAATKVISEEYSLEYGTDKIEMHVGAVEPGERAIIIE